MDTDKPIVIKFLGRERTLEYPMWVIKDLKNQGIDILQLDPENRGKGMFDGLDPDKITYLVWSGFRHEDPDLTLEQTERGVTPRFITVFVFKFLEACGAGEEEVLKKKALAAMTGK